MGPPANRLTLAELQDWILTEGFYVLAVIVLALLARWLLIRTIGRIVTSVSEKNRTRTTPQDSRYPGARILQQATGLGNERHAQRVSTLGSLMRSIVTFVISLVAILTVMAVIGLPLGPVLASAGVGGVALGFGAQTLVKDFISGVFMILEDQYGVGDLIDVGPVVGTVEEVGLRITRLRDEAGVIWYVRNGELTRIGNHSQGSGLPGTEKKSET